jgi:hypothetical protein
VKSRVDGAPYPAGIALVEPDGHNLRHRVVPGLVIAGHHPERTVLMALERIAGLSREDVDSASVQDLQDIFGERPQQPLVLPVGVEAADFTVELVVKPDQVGYHGLQDDPSDPATEPLILLVQAVDDRFPVRRTPVELGELFLHLVQAPGHPGEQHLVGLVPARRQRSLGPDPFAGPARVRDPFRVRLDGGPGGVLVCPGQDASPPSGRTRTTFPDERVVIQGQALSEPLSVLQLVRDLGPLPEQPS